MNPKPSAMAPTRGELREQLQSCLGEDLAQVQQILSQQFRSPHEYVAEICGHVVRFQGKQIRPTLLLLCARACGLTAERADVAHRLGAVVEMIHTATLVHDDVIDDADMRRHVSTVHRRWNAETSVLLGDYLFSKAFHLAATTGDAEACRVIGRATDRTCEGELNQIAARMEQSHSERTYFRVIAGKTGQLFAVSCLLGARSAEASRDVQARLRIFGMRLGLAFQIADDILDLTQSPETTGKDSGNDLHNRRLTLPILRACEALSAAGREQLLLRLSSDDPGEVMQVREMPEVLRGALSAHRTAVELADRAIRCLSRCIPSTATELLEGIARLAVQRDS